MVESSAIVISGGAAMVVATRCRMPSPESWWTERAAAMTVTKPHLIGSVRWRLHVHVFYVSARSVN